MKLTGKLILSVTIVTIIIVLASINFFWVSQKELLMQQAHAQAKTLFKMLVVTRQWVAENRDEIVPVPAVATKELSEYAKVMTDFRFHITSDMLINPDNAPDDFELRAMHKFRTANNREYSEVVRMRDQNYYRYMAPLYVNEACLECHDYQGYQVGDLRGGISITLPMQEIEAAIEQNNRNYFMVGIFSFFGIVVTMVFLLKAVVLKNIDNLTKAASSYKEGDFSHQLNVKTGDEIEELAEAFEVMRHSILENEDHLKAELRKVSSQYTSAMEALRERNEELKSVNIFKTDILDSLSHELRTPLTKIIAYSDLLKQQGLDCNLEMRTKSLDAVNRSAKLLNTLFSEIITLSRLESNQHPYHFIPVEIKNMVEDMIQLHEKDIADKNLSIEINIPDESFLCVDGESFKHVVTNLISNAVKFNKHGGSIKISYTDNETHKQLHVSDTGAGIPEAEIAKVTERFYRGTNVKAQFSGTGLGLSIVRRIIEGHNGKLDITSEVDKGSTFTLHIPRQLQCSKNFEEDEDA
ncbi:MAG: ATP-binding protein [Deferribacterales bacterium]